MKSKLFTGMLVLILMSSSYGQTGEWTAAGKQEIIDAYHQACNWLINTPSYYFKIKYATYKDHSTKVHLESSDAFYKRVMPHFRTEALGVKTIQNTKWRFVVDSGQKTITVMNAANYTVNIAGSEELSEMLDQFKALRKRKVSKSVLCYRIEFEKNNLYDAYEFSVNSRGLLEHLIFYYSEQDRDADLDTGEPGSSGKISPRLEISFYDYQVPAKYSSSEFDDTQIVVNDNGQIDLLGDYKNYRLLDYRLKK